MKTYKLSKNLFSIAVAVVDDSQLANQVKDPQRNFQWLW